MKQNSSWFISVIAILFFLLAEYIGMTNGLRNVLESVLLPISGFGVSLVQVVRWPYQVLSNAHNAAARIQDLESRYAESLAALSRMKAVEEENQALRESIENTDRKLADVVVSAPIVSYGIPHINVGFQDGVEVGDPVFVSQVMIGRVSVVSPQQAEVRLLSNVLSGPVLVRTESGYDGVAVGDGRRVLLNEIPIDVDIVVGESVVTLGQEGIDRDLFIGKVKSIEKKPQNATQEIIVEQLVSFYEARIVEVHK